MEYAYLAYILKPLGIPATIPSFEHTVLAVAINPVADASSLLRKDLIADLMATTNFYS